MHAQQGSEEDTAAGSVWGKLTLELPSPREFAPGVVGQQRTELGGTELTELVSSFFTSLTKYHSLRGLNKRHLFPYNLRGWKFKIKVAAGLVFLRGLSPGLTGGHLLPVVTWSPPCVSGS